MEKDNRMPVEREWPIMEQILEAQKGGDST